MRLFHRLMNYVISFQQTYVIKFWEPSNVLILSNYKILLVIPDRTCINFDHMVYYIYELRWASSDNTLKELDASGSFFCIGNKNKPPVLQVCFQKALASRKNLHVIMSLRFANQIQYNMEISEWITTVYHTQNGHANLRPIGQNVLIETAPSP